MGKLSRPAKVVPHNSLATLQIQRLLSRLYLIGRFRFKGIAFEYPRTFAFEADLKNLDSKSWTLSGNDLRIMYFVINAKLTTREYADGMIEQFGRKNYRVVDANVKITLGEHTLYGKIIEVKVSSLEIVIDIYKVPSQDGVRKFLVFQDSIDKAGNRSEEGKQTLNKVKSSFALERS